jgi:hypothetical protein
MQAVSLESLAKKYIQSLKVRNLAERTIKAQQWKLSRTDQQGDNP